MKKNQKTFTSIICLLAAALVFLTCESWFLYACISSLLIYIAFLLLNALTALAKPIPKNTNPIAKACIVFVSLVVGCSGTKAIIPTINIAEQMPTVINKSIDKELKNIFEKYNVKTYEDVPNLTDLSCKIELRFTYILTQINKIEETNTNINKRYANLIERDKYLEKNINKVNKRARNAHSNLLIVTRPNILPEKINLTNYYDRISLWGKTIEKNIETPKCTTSCAFSHIDQASFYIVEEISEIHHKQDKINFVLTSLEKTYDELEFKQRTAEQTLTAKGF